MGVPTVTRAELIAALEAELDALITQRDALAQSVRAHQDAARRESATHQAVVSAVSGLLGALMILKGMADPAAPEETAPP